MSRSLLACSMILLLASGARAADIYVNPSSGNDANNGLAPPMAVRTVQRGFDLIGASGTLNLAAGAYSASLGQTFPARSAAVTTDPSWRPNRRSKRSRRRSSSWIAATPRRAAIRITPSGTATDR